MKHISLALFFMVSLAGATSPAWHHPGVQNDLYRLKIHLQGAAELLRQANQMAWAEKAEQLAETTTQTLDAIQADHPSRFATASSKLRLKYTVFHRQTRQANAPGFRVQRDASCFHFLSFNERIGQPLNSRVHPDARSILSKAIAELEEAWATAIEQARPIYINFNPNGKKGWSRTQARKDLPIIKELLERIAPGTTDTTQTTTVSFGTTDDTEIYNSLVTFLNEKPMYQRRFEHGQLRLEKTYPISIDVNHDTQQDVIQRGMALLAKRNRAVDKMEHIQQRLQDLNDRLANRPDAIPGLTHELVDLQHAFADAESQVWQGHFGNKRKPKIESKLTFTSDPSKAKGHLINLVHSWEQNVKGEWHLRAEQIAYDPMVSKTIIQAGHELVKMAHGLSNAGQDSRSPMTRLQSAQVEYETFMYGVLTLP